MISLPALEQFQLVAALEIADVLLHPDARLLALPELDRRGDFALRLHDARARLRHPLDNARQGRGEQQVQGRLRQRQHLIAAGCRDRGEKIDHRGNRRVGVVCRALEAGAGAREVMQLRRAAAYSAAAGSIAIIASHSSKKVTSCRASARLTPELTRRGSGRVTRRRFSPRPRPSNPWTSSSRIASRMVERLTPNWRARSVSDGNASPARSDLATMRCSMRLAICR